MSRPGIDPFRQFFRGGIYYVRGVYQRFMEDEILLYGSALAFNCILCIIPLLLLLTSLIGVFLSSSELTIQRVNELLNAAFPDQPYAIKIKTSIQDVVFEIIDNRTSFGVVSILVLTWTTTFLFGATRSILNRIFRLKSSKMFVLTILENILAVIAVGILFLLSNFIFWISSLLESMVEGIPEIKNLELGTLVQTFPTIITSVLVFAMFYIVYQFMPDRRIHPKAALISALTTTILWVLSGKGFQFYLSHFSSVSKVYGTYAFLLVFMIWIEYSSLVFILGAIAGQLYRERVELLSHPPGTA